MTGLIERVTFHSAETGFAVLRVKVRGQRDLVTVVGTLPSVSAGEWLDAHGRWVVDSEHGQQFKAALLRTSHPNTKEGIEKFLASGLIKGIGPKIAALLVREFGTDVFEVIEKESDRLVEVDGIGKVRKARITQAWQEQRTVREIMVFLHSHGVGTSRAFRIHKVYGEKAIESVQENPYRLVQDVWGIGFKTADQIAESLGVDKHSALRARAGVEFVLQELTTEGHCAFPRPALEDRAVKMLDIPLSIVQTAVGDAIHAERLTERATSERGSLVYLASLDGCEQNLARNLWSLSTGVHPCPPIEVDKAVEWVESRLGFRLAKSQKEALALAVSSKVLVVTGGPGVGKTTLVNAIVKVFRAKKLRVVLCAPTGRAARRLSESAGLPSKTIHRLLEFDPATGGFKRDSENPLDGDVLVVDETSMVDLVLAHQFVRAVPKHAALVFVGDVDQLPSVGPGSVLADIITSGTVPFCRLTEVFRQAQKSAIVINAHRVNQGLMPTWPKKVDDPKESDFYFVKADEPEDAVSKIVRAISERIPARFGLDPINDIQVLTPMQRGELGARKLNQILQHLINPGGIGVDRYGWTFRVGDKVMQIVNNYEKDVSNGDIGRVVGLNMLEQELNVSFDDREVKYDFGELDELMLSYAVTIHKSQGSEYPCVVVPIHMQHYMLLQRNLVYTAITRGRKLVVLVGQRKAVGMAVRRVESRGRITTLKERLSALKDVTEL